MLPELGLSPRYTGTQLVRRVKKVLSLPVRSISNSGEVLESKAMKNQREEKGNATDKQEVLKQVIWSRSHLSFPSSARPPWKGVLGTPSATTALRLLRQESQPTWKERTFLKGTHYQQKQSKHSSVTL